MPGTASRKSSSRLLAISVDRIDSPVTLPPGRAKLAITPPRMGSAPNVKTMGMTSVACLNVLTAIEVETMTSTLSRTNSAAISAWRCGIFLGPAILHRDGATLDPAQFTQSLHKRRSPGLEPLSSLESDGRQFARLLRARRNWPRQPRHQEA